MAVGCVHTGLPHEKLVLAYTCGRNDVHLLEKLVHYSKIPLIFDLDQTLLTAFTVNSLIKGLGELATELCGPEADMHAQSLHGRTCGVSASGMLSHRLDELTVLDLPCMLAPDAQALLADKSCLHTSLEPCKPTLTYGRPRSDFLQREGRGCQAWAGKGSGAAGCAPRLPAAPGHAAVLCRL